MKSKSNINYKDYQTRSPPGCKSFYIVFLVIIRNYEKYDLSNTI
jgi:hypothetical protein